MSTRTRRSVRAALPWVFVVALVLVALNLRAPFVAVAPISEELREDLDVSGAAIGLLTSLPVLCFGLFAPLALLVVRRAGAELALVACLCSVVVGSVVRSAATYPLAVVGTVVIGVGITVGNIVVPVLIRRDSPPTRVGLVTGIYVSAMNLGSMVVNVVTPGLSDAVGWQLALAAWGLMAAVGLLAWLAFMRRRRPDPHTSYDAAPAPPTTGSPVRRPLAWILALAFAAQSTSYYSLTAWLPTLLSDEIGLGRGAAGAASSVFQVSAIIGALGVPVLALRWPSWLAIGLVGVCWMQFPLVLLVDPHAYLLASVLGGVAQGGGFAALFTVVVHVSRSDRESAQVSAFVQGVGYVFAAVGPTVLGLAHDATTAWTVPMLVIVGTTVSFSVLGVLAGVLQSRHHPAP